MKMTDQSVTCALYFKGMWFLIICILCGLCWLCQWFNKRYSLNRAQTKKLIDFHCLYFNQQIGSMKTISCWTFQMSNFGKLDDHIRYQLDCLVEQLSTESPIRPMKGFKLDFSTVLGLFGLTTTYTIVLLQFKIDEK